MNNLITKLYVKASNNIHCFLKKEDGVTAIEYAIVAAGVSVVVLALFGSDGKVAVALDDIFVALGTKLKGVING